MFDAWLARFRALLAGPTVSGLSLVMAPGRIRRMIPRTLEEWSADAVIGLLAKGCYENEQFDFKEALPDHRNKDEKLGLVKDCCAFANSDGGFIVFGVKNDRSLAPRDRLAGVHPGVDVPEHFGNYASQCRPGVGWDFKNPPIQLPNGRLCHVIHVPRSWKAPHAVGDPEAGWRFLKRTNKGNEGMSHEEIRAQFLGYYEKRLKLLLLHAELQEVRRQAEGMIIPEQEVAEKYTLGTFELRVVESVLADTFTILVEVPGVLKLLNELRSLCGQLNSKIRLFYATVPLPLSNKQAIVREHNLFMRDRASAAAQVAGLAAAELKKYLDGRA